MCCFPSYSFLGNGTSSPAAWVWSGVPLSCEAAAHATRLFFQNMPSIHLLLKFDFKNALHNKMIGEVKRNASELFAFIRAAYGKSSLLFCGDYTIASEEGVQ